LTPGRKSSPSWLRWLPSGKIVFKETIDGGTAIATLDPPSRVAETLWKEDESIGAGDEGLSTSSDGRTIATIRTSWTLAPEIWAGPVGEWKQLTHDNDGLKPLWGKTQNLHWKSDDFDVEGWLMYPVNYDESKKYPLVVSVHGGPAAAKRPSWPSSFDMTLLSSQGYFVLFPNPRGSYGRASRSRRITLRTSARAICATFCWVSMRWSDFCLSIPSVWESPAGVMAAT